MISQILVDDDDDDATGAVDYQHIPAWHGTLGE